MEKFNINKSGTVVSTLLFVTNNLFSIKQTHDIWMISG